MSEFSPREIVSELDRFIIGQADAKRAVAIALRNRWRRKQLPEDLRAEVTPKNILMIGPTGVGKTEISRRLAKLANAPFLKVEATKFTEVGYVGRDVEQIVRDLVEVAFTLVRDKRRKEVSARAEAAAEERVLSAICGATASKATREEFRVRLRSGRMDDSEIEIEIADSAPNMGGMDLPGQSGMVLNLGDILGKAMSGRTKRVKMTVREAFKPVVQEESDKLLDPESLAREAVRAAEEDGIVFIDEIDKVAARSGERSGADVSREGVQRDLLPLLEGSVVNTKRGPVRTDYVLFIASGAFHLAKPSDLLPELQGRLPIRVELKPLTREDFRRILTEPEASLIAQYTALIGAEGVKLSFTPEAIDAVAGLAVQVNETVENIGARRLHTVLERLLDDISFTAPDRSGETLVITEADVMTKVAGLAANVNLSKFVL